jgi:hypothetical protein
MRLARDVIDQSQDQVQVSSLTSTVLDGIASDDPERGAIAAMLALLGEQHFKGRQRVSQQSAMGFWRELCDVVGR